MWRIVSANKRAIGVCIKPSARAVASPSWMKQAQSVSAALPHSKAFSSMMMKGRFNQEQEKHSFNTSARTMTTAAAPAVEEKQDDSPDSMMGIAQKYGLYPLAVLGTVAAVSKEIYFLGPETLLLGNFCMTFFVGYVLGADVINAYLEGEKKAFRAKIDDIVDLETAYYQSKITEYQSRLNTVEWLEDCKKNEIDTMKAVSDAKVFTAKHEAVEATLRKLRSIANDEAEFESNATLQLSVDAANFVREEFAKASDFDRAKVLENAISDLGKDGVLRDEKEDPIKNLYKQFLTKGEESEEVSA